MQFRVSQIGRVRERHIPGMMMMMLHQRGHRSRTNPNQRQITIKKILSMIYQIFARSSPVQYPPWIVSVNESNLFSYYFGSAMSHQAPDDSHIHILLCLLAEKRRTWLLFFGVVRVAGRNSHRDYPVTTRVLDGGDKGAKRHAFTALSMLTKFWMELLFGTDFSCHISFLFFFSFSFVAMSSDTVYFVFDNGFIMLLLARFFFSSKYESKWVVSRNSTNWVVCSLNSI